MHYLKKSVTISAAHHLRKYDGPCGIPHGHNWNITVYCKSRQLCKQGFVIDFSEIKKIVNEFDHIELNELAEFQSLGGINPTAENIAKILYDKIPYCYQIDVEETSGSIITYTKEPLNVKN